MGTITNFLLCSFVVGIAQTTIIFEPDRPFLKLQVHDKADLKCCYTTSDNSVKVHWIKVDGNKTLRTYPLGQTVEFLQRVPKGNSVGLCGTLTFNPVKLNDTGFYQCLLKGNIVSHGTYLQVYQPMKKTINLSESTKNRILTAEGVLLLLCVLMPSVTLLCKSKRLNQLEKKKAKKEEENIYQGLNLDDCSSAYDRIERSQAHGQYQDVSNIKEEEEQIQLEKP
ncbi:B-cell antigen receptor complex-associated protein alpha chain [Anarrhichthys ocellatus]|uniref:B-cell antigen receptor complex-associated protein alpha chain n=1 Tax=Anarrhichthys ocellatus TaxID=433405 RepID=UPI0012EEDCBA|nr:B-cell antigen receptor complex-associated protein alpha chain [Anarrhichthys ocellatus]